MARKIILASLVLASLASLSACNTVRGVGKDLESVANAGDRIT